jgi:uncharacterized alkaline shock family protein YloU
MKGTLENKLGKVSIDSEVIAQYAGSTAVECFGIVGMAAVSMKDGLVKLLKGDSLTRGISVVIDENNLIEIDFHVIISYGVSIAAVADKKIFCNTFFKNFLQNSLKSTTYCSDYWQNML